MTKLYNNGFVTLTVKSLVVQFVCYVLIVRGQAVFETDSPLEPLNKDHNGWYWPSIFEWPFQISKLYKNIYSRDEDNEISNPPKQNKPSVQAPTPILYGDHKLINSAARLEPINEMENYIGELETMSARVARSAVCTAEGFFHIENDCKRFFRCVRNDGVGNKAFTKFEFTCGEGTIWDPENTACNHPWAVQRSDCKNSIDSDNESDPNQNNNEGDPDINGDAEGDANQNGNNGDASQEGSQNVGNEQQPQGSYQGLPPLPVSADGSQAPELENGDASQPNGYGDSGTNPSSQNNIENYGNQSCMADGFYPFTNNCKKFIRCVSNGYGGYTKYEFDCAEGTVWDVDTTTCNFPYAVSRQDCNSDSYGSGQSTNYENSGGTLTTSTPYGQNSFTPSQYPSATITNQQSTSNVISSSTMANQQQTPLVLGQQTPSSNNLPSTPSQNNPQGSTTNLNNNNSSGITFTTDQTWSPSSGQQTLTTNVQNTNVMSTTGGTNQQGQDVCASEGFFPSSKSCQKFYRCVSYGGSGYTKYEFNCGPGTVWDPDLNTCNHPWAVNNKHCQPEGANSSGTSTKMNSTPSFSNTPSYSASSVAPSDQNTTINYSEPSSNPSPYSTTPSVSPDQNNTNYKNPSMYTTSTTIKPDSTNPSLQITTTASPSTASNNNTTINGAGDKPEMCKNTTTPPKRNDQIKCEKAGFYPHPQNCKKFYRCVDWDGDKGKRFNVFHFDCPAGTIFDPSLNICNHENSVYPPRDCSGDDTNGTSSSADADSNQSSCMPANDTTPSTNRPEATTNGGNNTDTSTVGISSETPKPSSTTTADTTATATTADTPITAGTTTTADATATATTAGTTITAGTTTTAGTTIADTTTTMGTTTTASTTTASTATTAGTTIISETPNTEATTDNAQTTTEGGSSMESTPSSIGSTPTTNIDEVTTTISPSTNTPALTTTTTTDDASTIASSTAPTQTEITTTITSSTAQTQTEVTTAITSSTLPTQTEITTVMASTTIASEVSDKCPKDISDNQFVLVCPTGFRRHPKYCDVFYQCTVSETKPGEIKVLTLSCPNGTIYDADKVQCLPADQTSKCDAQTMASNSGKNVKQMPTSGNVLPLTSSSKSFCPNEGSFPYADDCSLFYKCTASNGGKLNGYIYQCPEGYVYYKVSKRCEKMNKVPCEGGKRLSSVLKSVLTATAPVETKNIGH